MAVLRKVPIVNLFKRTKTQEQREQVIRSSYRKVLGRDVDPEGLAYHERQMRNGAITATELVANLKESIEYKVKSGQAIGADTALHHCRMILFSRHLPAAERILDLGGAAIDHPEGALLAMGYPHTPEKVTIVDLPPGERLRSGKGAEPSLTHTTEDGVQIEYHYRNMADLECFEDSSFDLVVSGESIEHISESDADIMVKEVFRVLVPGGNFCLDTPNARLTRIQSPDALIHPEHQKEYLPNEVRDKLVDAGFKIEEMLSVVPMPETIQSGVFDLDEMPRNLRVGEDPDEGYVFYIRASKPL